jgi:hypothetical protein
MNLHFTTFCKGMDGYGGEMESEPNRRTTDKENDGDGSFSTSKEERQRNKKQEDIQINIHIRVPNNNPTKMVMTTTKAELPPADPKRDNKKRGILLNSFSFFF